VHFNVHDGVVQLAGIVRSFTDRQLIIAVTRHVAGVLRVDDQIIVEESSARRQKSDDDTLRQSEQDARIEVPRNRFSDIPVLTESLEDLLARQTTNAVAAS
jgi:hypothetical protein